MGTPLARGEREASHPNRLVLQGASQPKRRSWEDIQRSPGRAPGLFASVVATPPSNSLARRGSGPVMRFPAREARGHLARTENGFLDRLSRGSPGDDSRATLMAIPIAIFALEVTWLPATAQQDR
jgi:hypothetical protein